MADAREPYPLGFRAILADPPYGEVDAARYVPGADAYPEPRLIVQRAGSKKGLSFKAYTEQTGRKHRFVAHEVQAAEVYEAVCSQVQTAQVADKPTYIAEIHSAPRWLWKRWSRRCLVKGSSLVADEVQFLNSLPARPDGDALYIPLCEAMHSVPPPPRFTFGDSPNDLMARYFSESYCGPVGVYCLTNMSLFGQALLFRNDIMFQCHEIQVHHGTLPFLINEYRSAAGQIRTRPESGKCVLLLGPGYEIYGHWLVDFLPKLFILQTAGFDLTSLKYLIPANTPKFGFDLLDLFGITEGNRVIYDSRVEVIQPQQLVIPTMARTNSRTSRLFGDAVKFMGSQIWARHRRPALRNDMTRIFISRARANKQFRRLLNRDRIEQIVAEAGFSIIHPEQLPLLEQFAIFDNASQIMGEYGSALHASIFSRAGTMLCALRGSGSPIAGFLQSAIGDALNHPTGYVIGETVAEDRMESFNLSEDALKTCLRLVFSGRPLM